MLKSIYNQFHKHYHSKYHGVYQHAKQLFIFDLFLLAGAVVLFIAGLILFFWKPGIMDQIELSLSLGDNRIKSGETVRLTVDYTNHSKFTLNNPILALKLPPGFVVDRTKTPESVFSNNSTFHLSAIDPGGSGRAELYGRLWAEPKQETRVIAILSYTPENKKTPEQKLGSLIAVLPESVLKGSLTIATTSFPGTKIPLTFTLTNTGNETVDTFDVPFTWVGGIAKQETPDKSTLKPNETLAWKETLITPAKTGAYSVVFEPKITINNHTINQGRFKETITLFYPSIALNAKLANTSTAFVEPGAIIPIEVSWKNTSQYAINNQRLRLKISPAGVVDLVLTAKENRLKNDNEGFYADQIVRTALANGKPGSTDSFVVNLILRPTFAITGQPERAQLEITPVIEGAINEVEGQSFVQPGEPVKLPIATELNFNTESRYYTDEGDQLGRGPLPPVVGETTKYWVFSQVKNGTNAVSEARFETGLPINVTFTGKQSVSIGPRVQFDSGSRLVSWNYRELPANSVTGLYFEVSVTPTPDQLGKTIQLTKNLIFSATDEVTGKMFNLSNPGLNNILGKNDKGVALGAEVR